MSESGILQILTLLISSATGVAMLWLKSRIDKKDEYIKVVNQEVKDQVSNVMLQNSRQTKKLDSIHEDINGRVAELVAAKVAIELSGLSQKIAEALTIAQTVKRLNSQDINISNDIVAEELQSLGRTK